ncbi:MAG: UDP-glucose 4-epimerase [Betaproteobacteria bacterium]|nr:MAG: UDP-glucose 4-epimerase [Betaproteobacteria bacterium]
MRVAVTGASGFIGSALCRDLREQGLEVVAAVRDRVALDAARVSVVGEIGPKVDWRPTLRGCDAVVHLAGRVHVASRADESALVPYRRVNRDGSVALAEQAAELGVRRFVFVSTILVNGPDSSRPFLASDVPAPRDPYAISKLEAELALSDLAARTGMELVIVRPPLVYGPDVRANFLRLLKLAASGIPLPLAGVPGVRSFISRWNLNDLLILCLRHPAAAGRVILASDGEDISLPDLIRHLAHAMGRPCRLFSAPPGVLRTIAGSLGARSVVDKLFASLRVDISETRSVLGWNPPVPLREGLTRTAVWYSRSRAGALAQHPGADTARTGQSSAARKSARPPQEA